MTENAAKERPRTSDLCEQIIKLNYQKQIQLNQKKKKCQLLTSCADVSEFEKAK